jgi:hypothetical protein
VVDLLAANSWHTFHAATELLERMDQVDDTLGINNKYEHDEGGDGYENDYDSHCEESSVESSAEFSEEYMVHTERREKVTGVETKDRLLFPFPCHACDPTAGCEICAVDAISFQIDEEAYRGGKIFSQAEKERFLVSQKAAMYKV